MSRQYHEHDLELPHGVEEALHEDRVADFGHLHLVEAEESVLSRDVERGLEERVERFLREVHVVHLVDLQHEARVARSPFVFDLHLRVEEVHQEGFARARPTVHVDALAVLEVVEGTRIDDQLLSVVLRDLLRLLAIGVEEGAEKACLSFFLRF